MHSPGLEVGLAEVAETTIAPSNAAREGSRVERLTTFRLEVASSKSRQVAGSTTFSSVRAISIRLARVAVAMRRLAIQTFASLLAETQGNVPSAVPTATSLAATKAIPSRIIMPCAK